MKDRVEECTSRAWPARLDVTQKRKAAILICVTYEAVVLATPGGIRRCILWLRSRRGWNQAKLGATVGRSQQWVSSLESRYTDVSLGDVVTALRALGATVVVRESAATQPPRQAQVGAVIESRTVSSAAEVGALVREARVAAAMTQQQLADLAVTTRQWVNRLEQGRSKAVLSKMLAALDELGLEMVARIGLLRPGLTSAARARPVLWGGVSGPPTCSAAGCCTCTIPNRCRATRNSEGRIVRRAERHDVIAVALGPYPGERVPLSV